MKCPLFQMSLMRPTQYLNMLLIRRGLYLNAFLHYLTVTKLIGKFLMVSQKGGLAYSEYTLWKGDKYITELQNLEVLQQNLTCGLEILSTI